MQLQHLPALCSLSSRSPEQAATSQPLPGFYANHKGCSHWEHAQFGSVPCNNSQLESSHTLTHTLLQPTVGATGKRGGCLLSLQSLSHTERATNTHFVTTKVSPQTWKYESECVGFGVFSIKRETVGAGWRGSMCSSVYRTTHILFMMPWQRSGLHIQSELNIFSWMAKSCWIFSCLIGRVVVDKTGITQ